MSLPLARPEDAHFEGEEQPLSLPALCALFLRVACTSFGGNMAMIAAAQRAVVERRRLLGNDEFLDGVSLAALLPGPQAVNVVAFAGYRLRGAPGALLAIAASMLPAFVLMLLASMAYLHWSAHPVTTQVFAAIVPAVAAIILAAALGMWRQVSGVPHARLLAAGAALVMLVLPSAWSAAGIILAALGVGLHAQRRHRATSDLTPTKLAMVARNPRRRTSLSRAETSLLAIGGLGVGAALLASFNGALLTQLLLAFGGMSLMLFGGAYAFVPLLQHAVIDTQGWLTHREFVDALAMAQAMPGPVIVVVVFVGFKLAGVAGALLATLGIVAPAAALMLACSHGLERLRGSPRALAALQCVRAAVIGMVAASAVLILKGATPGMPAVFIGVASLVALLRFRVEPVWVTAIAALSGFLVH